MSLSTIAILVIISSLLCYLIFLTIGLGGIEKNRKAQGLEQNFRKNK